jgi:hypothetical protein
MLLVLLLLLTIAAPCMAQKSADPYPGHAIRVPRLDRAVTVDGDLSEWSGHAFTDGLWDIARLRQTPWFDPARNRITDHGGEAAAEEADLAARYYIAWDEKYLYLGAAVTDNVNDVTDPAHEPKRWYYNDAICWFVEAPRGTVSRQFGEGDNAFCFVIDASRPSYGAWWRHGAPGKTYIEEPLPKDAVQYAIRMRGASNFVLEARVALAPTLGVSSSRWRAPRVGDIYGLQIVHTDPDGGDYGGHFLIYGRGDDDATWGRMELVGPIVPERRKAK